MKKNTQTRTVRKKNKFLRVAKRRVSFTNRISKKIQIYYKSLATDCQWICSSVVDDCINVFKRCFPRFWRKIKGFEPLRNGSFDDYSERSRRVILPKDVLGDKGERLVFDYIKENSNYEVVACNTENYYCELDLIYIDKPKRQIVFVEVKTRRHDYIKYPAFRAVDAKRRKKMALAAEQFVNERGYFQYSKRFDVAVVIWPLDSRPTIAYYRNAFSYKYAILGYKKEDFGKTRRKTTTKRDEHKILK